MHAWQPAGDGPDGQGGQVGSQQGMALMGKAGSQQGMALMGRAGSWAASRGWP
jgi:hypothetical protein